MEEKAEKKRTEEQKIFQDSIILVLGGKKYEVKPLVIKKSRKWRASFTKTLGSLPKYMGITSNEPDKFADAVNAMLVAAPDKVIDLIFEYAPQLNREAIENNATDAEMARAFEQIVEVTFPLAQSLFGVMGKLSP